MAKRKQTEAEYLINNRKKQMRNPFVNVFIYLLSFYVLLAIIKAFAFDISVVNTSNMEQSILKGDVLVVNKLKLGSRTPITPLSIPFSSLLSSKEGGWYSDIIRLKYFRIPGINGINYNDLIVYNTPEDMDNPIDKKTQGVLRVYGLPGDTLEIRNSVVYVNNNEIHEPFQVQYTYQIKANSEIDLGIFAENGIQNIKRLKDNKYLVQTSPSVVDVLKENSKIDAINRIIPEHVYQDKVYPRNDVFKWSPILYGPVLTPQIGTEIVLNPENIALYKYLIINFERKKLDVLDDGKVYIDDEEKISYTFENDYYFALGDNRDDAIDSRFIGFIPESHIVGITSSILISFDDQTGAIRFGHVFKSIN